MAHADGASVPANLTDHTRALILLSTDAGVRNLAVDDYLATLPVEGASAARRFYAWPGKRNYEGRWWFASTGRHIAHESLLEAGYLMVADHDPQVVAVASQPLIFLWPCDAPGAKWHVPDYFVRLADGTGRLIDVRAPEHVDKAAEQFVLTRGACRAIGWDYQVFTGLPEPYASNLRWLSGYRHPRHSPSPETEAVVVEAFTPATSLAAGLRRAGRLLGGNGMSVVGGNVLHMLYHHALRADLDVALSMDSHIEAVGPRRAVVE